MLIAAVVLGMLGVAIQAWVDSRAHAAIETHAATEQAAWQGIREDVQEIKADVKEIKREMK